MNRIAKEEQLVRLKKVAGWVRDGLRQQLDGPFHSPFAAEMVARLDVALKSMSGAGDDCKVEDVVKLERGTQIVYVPNHANGVGHPDAEAGFVTSVKDDCAFCRYWSKHHPGELRTKANSELTPRANLVIHDFVPQSQVQTQLDWIDAKLRGHN